MKQLFLTCALAVLVLSAGVAQGTTTLDLALIGSPANNFEPFEVNLSFNVLPDSMGTGNEMGSGWDTFDPNYTFSMSPLLTMTTEYYWGEPDCNPLDRCMSLSFAAQTHRILPPDVTLQGIPDASRTSSITRPASKWVAATAAAIGTAQI